MRSTHLSTLLFGALVVGCGGAAAETTTTTTTPVEAPPPATAAHARGSDVVSARVGRMGGDLELANGARLEIEPGAITQEVQITMRSVDDGQAFGDRETRRPLTPVVDVSPGLMAQGGAHFRFSMPAQPIPSGFSEDDLALGHERDATRGRLTGSATHTRWDMFHARVINGRFVAELDELGGHRLQFGVSR